MSANKPLFSPSDDIAPISRVALASQAHYLVLAARTALANGRTPQAQHSDSFVAVVALRAVLAQLALSERELFTALGHLHVSAMLAIANNRDGHPVDLAVAHQKQSDINAIGISILVRAGVMPAAGADAEAADPERTH